ncbi:dihydrofolate reductase family protein [Zhouia sp. PK063]|uniref:dihydrofolate reductase family protein n=1 Tax=Zhouia sp. PK063 TaxID=3373602 RepID=UPI0037A04CE2
MRKIISFMHISLDGFVAGPNGEMDWIKVDEQIFDYVGKRIARCNTALYGRVTYEMMENYWPTAADKPNASKHDIEHSKWYKSIHKVVLSTTLENTNSKKVTIINDDLVNQIHKIKQHGEGELLLFGSPKATHALMQENLIDGYWLFVNPVILGKGIPLFIQNQKSDLKLNATKSFVNGVVELSYSINK